MTRAPQTRAASGQGRPPDDPERLPDESELDEPADDDDRPDEEPDGEPDPGLAEE
ncbi:MAG: hypothetical protein M3Q31_15650 [Actinomycetota bacterium]|nr:hypothetical protein [Actinomycetota bacterium]